MGRKYYQIFCGIRISPENQLTNYKLIDGILLELSRKLKVQEQQKVLADAWKPYMKNLDTVYTDASCYESLMRFPTDVKLLWECTVRAYKMMCGISSQLGEHRLRTKYNDIEKANLAYRKQRRHERSEERNQERTGQSESHSHGGFIWHSEGTLRIAKDSCEDKIDRNHADLLRYPHGECG